MAANKQIHSPDETEEAGFTPYGAGFRKSHWTDASRPTIRLWWGRMESGMEMERGPRLLFRDASRELIPRPRIANNRRCSVSRPVTPRVQQRDCSFVSRATVSSPQVARRNNNISGESAIGCLLTLWFDNESPMCVVRSWRRVDRCERWRKTRSLFIDDGDGGSYRCVCDKGFNGIAFTGCFRNFAGKNVWMLVPRTSCEVDLIWWAGM